MFIVGHLGGIGGRKVFPIAPTDGENSCKLQELTQGVRRCKRVYSTDGLSCTLSAVGGGGGEKTGLYAVPCRINKPIGEGSCSQLSIKEINNQTAGCLSSRYYKGLAENGCNAVITIQKTHGKNVSLKSDETGTLQAARLDKVPNVLVAPVLTPEREEKQQNGKRIKDAGEPMFTLTAQEPHGVVIQQLPHGFNAGGEKDIAPTLTGSAYQHNNFVKGVYTNASKDFQRQPLEDMSRTIKAEKHDAGIYDGVRIRRLTPRECWRLQGFPDEYFNKAQAVGISDSQLYKQAGNSVSVPVAKAIGVELRRIELCQGDTNNLKITD